MGFPRVSHRIGLFMDFAWVSHGFPVGFPWVPTGFPRVSHGFPTGLAFHGFRMGFP